MDTYERDIVTRFATDVTQHQMTVAHNDGLYRHLTFRNPEHSWNLWFELVTTPGTLTIVGDMGAYTFRRTEDMFTFFRGSAHRGEPNPHYWAQKLANDHNTVMHYNQDLMIENIWQDVRDHYGDNPVPDGLHEAIQADIIDVLTGDECSDLETVEAFEFYINEEDRFDSRVSPDFTFSETWEWSVKRFDLWYLWACHAIVWGIAQYDAQVKVRRPFWRQVLAVLARP